MVIYVPNRPKSVAHLEHVKAEMMKLGPPVIPAVHVGGGTYYAIDGSHRTCAAHALGLYPKIARVEDAGSLVKIIRHKVSYFFAEPVHAE
jgi:hypothetical protein